MSAEPFGKGTDPKRLVETIIEKTKAGKLHWQETADDKVFIASVGGNTTLKVSSEEREERMMRALAGEARRLRLLDDTGTAFLVIEGDNIHAVEDLFDLARKSALKVDERVQSLIEVLQKL